MGDFQPYLNTVFDIMSTHEIDYGSSYLKSILFEIRGDGVLLFWGFDKKK